MGEKTAVDAVASVVLQKLGGLLEDESFASNKIIGYRLKRMQEDLKKTRSSLTKAAAMETNDEEIKKLTRVYLGFVYSIEDSIETFALRFTRRRKRLGFLMNHALFLNKFTALKMLSGKLNSIRTEVKELDRRTSGLDGSKKTVTSPHTQGSDYADDEPLEDRNEGHDDGKGKGDEADGEQDEEREGEDDDYQGKGGAEEMEPGLVSSTGKAIDGRRPSMKGANSSPTPQTPKNVHWKKEHYASIIQEGSDALIIQERTKQSKLMYSYSYNEEALSIVGYTHKVAKLWENLDNTDSWIIPLVGELGLGKTMLARAVYGDRTISNEFEVVAWVNIFKESNTTDILLSLLNQVKKSEVQDGSSDEHLKSKLSQELAGQRYLIVLDGVQTPDQWLFLKNAFPEQPNGSKIILTTCDKQVAEYDDQKWRPYYLKKLKSEESWTLFMKKAGLQEDPDHELKSRIIEGCQGLPLNIVLLGSLLSMKGTGNWPETLDTLSSSSVDKKWQASDILKLSYNDLDIHVKLCLIYMTLFPKELDIPVRRLQRLWLAEGFVEQKQDEFQEDVAQKHFDDLVKRSLIMVSKQRSDGSPRKCRLLGALRDLLLAEVQDISLFHVHPGPDCQRANRRLIEHACAEPCPLEPSQSQQLRSYISFNSQKKDTPAKYVSSLVSKMVGKGLGLLRVLDLEQVYKPSLPENLGDLFHLKYLGLRWTFLDKLPKSVGELPYLETLDLKHTNIDKIPTSIWKLRNLQHLNLHEVHLDKDTPLHFSRSLPKLLTLWGLSVSHESPINNGLKKLEHLRELGISFRLIKRSDNAAEGSKSTPPAQSTEALVEWISQLKDLRSLRLRSIDDTGCPAHLSLKPFSELNELSHMKLLGKLQQLPPIDHFPPQIKVLTLSLSYLNEDPMPILGKLTSLTVLRLLGSSYLGEKMVCKRGTFKSLEVLKLWVLEKLKIWEVEEGAMEKLKEVNIRRCRKLENFPSRLLQQKTFKELILNDMPTAFKEKVEKECPFKVSIKDFRPRAEDLDDS